MSPVEKMINARIEQGQIKSGVNELASLDRHLNLLRSLLFSCGDFRFHGAARRSCGGAAFAALPADDRDNGGKRKHHLSARLDIGAGFEMTRRRLGAVDRADA